MTDEKKITYACGTCMHEGTEVCASCCTYQGGIPDRWERKPTYPCDPSKNTICRKRGCFINGGECHRTFHREFAQGDYQQELQSATEQRQRQGWISVKDRLPENGMDVLCCYEYYRYGSYNRMAKAVGIGGFIDGHFTGEPTTGVRAKVLYWMPLPELPKGE